MGWAAVSGGATTAGSHLRCVRPRRPARGLLPPAPPAPDSGGGEDQASGGVLPKGAQAQELRRENAQLREAMATRPVIDQARGVLMALGACGSERAWQMLVDTSQRTNTKLWRVAEMVVAGAGGGQMPRPVAASLRQWLQRPGAR
ncbi:ANTAR domain-containing protein [Streptomyces sp. NPDC046853]|uniref:ANTAR domain-containing protein n=1 Tax=Streptomyces sp. NPDC046853 TaxID=3154920 RepID=UPI0033FBA18B